MLFFLSFVGVLNIVRFLGWWNRGILFNIVLDGVEKVPHVLCAPAQKSAKLASVLPFQRANS